MSPAMNLGWVMMSLNTGMLWLTPVGEGGGGEKEGTCSVSNQWNIVLHTPQTPVTFDAVVVECFCHGGQSLLPCVTIGDQLEETD